MACRSKNPYGSCRAKMDKDCRLTSKHDHAWLPQNSKTCKDKWNGLHLNYKKITDYNKGIDHNIFYWELVVDECDKFHLPSQINCEFYEAIGMF